MGAMEAKKLTWPGRPTVPTLMARAANPPASMVANEISGMPVSRAT
jgi:hypothetical protein